MKNRHVVISRVLVANPLRATISPCGRRQERFLAPPPLLHAVICPVLSTGSKNKNVFYLPPVSPLA